MERLTFEGDFCDIAMCLETRGGSFCESGSCSQRKVWERLKEYEDTGLEPETCANYKQFEDEAISKGVTFNRIVELMKADSAGRLVVLPCRVGDSVHIPEHKFASEITEIIIDAKNNLNFYWAEYDRGPDGTELWDEGWFVPEDIGNTVFPLLEE